MKSGIYILKKTGQFVLAMAVLIAVVFFMSRLTPGDPLQSYYGDSLERMSESQRHEARERLGLNASMLSQFAGFLARAAGGDFGVSFLYKQSAIDVAAAAAPGTLILVVICFTLIYFLAAALAVFCVLREGKPADRIICRIGVTLASIPEFFAALFLILIFCVILNALPASGAYAIGQQANPVSWAAHLVLPVLAIVLTHLWYVAYMMRNKLSDELRKEYVLMYRAKGLNNRKIYRHCLKNIMPAAISIMAVFLPHLIGGTYVIETVFSYPGLGKLGFDSAKYHDYNMLMLISFMTGAVVISVNIAVQAVIEWIDPRTKQGGGG